MGEVTQNEKAEDNVEKTAEECKEDYNSGHKTDALAQSSNDADVEGDELAPIVAPDEVTEHIATETKPAKTVDDPIEDLPSVHPGSSVTDDGKTSGNVQEEEVAKVELDPKRKKDVCVDSHLVAFFIVINC